MNEPNYVMDKDLKTEPTSYSLQSSSEPLFSIQVLEFKTSLLEALEELRMRREAEIQYEEQIQKIIVEKQELQWQKENLQHQKETLTKQHKEAMALFKKQLQTRMCAMEEEKGQYQIASEIKEKEIGGLKETLKELQVSKYSLQKKVNEMEQKLQLHHLAKEDHQKQLNEIEKYYATITCQFGMVKESHKKLDQNVQEAIQLNKRLLAANKNLEFEVCSLKQELKKVTADFIKSKITCQYGTEEDINFTIKEQQFQELQEKLRMEIEVRKKVSEKVAYIQEEKQGIISSFAHIQQLLQRQTQNNIRMEAELKALKDNNQTLERDNELQREKVKENEEKFLNLQNKHEEARGTWEKHEKKLNEEIDEIKNELMSIKEAHLKLQESYNELSSQKKVFFEQDSKLQNGREAMEKENDISTEQKKSESIEIPTIQKWHHLQQETTTVNTMNFCSNTEYRQEGKDNQGQERDSEELQFFENNEKKEIDPSKERKAEKLPEEKLVKTSQSKAFSPDKDLLHQGQTWRVCTADLRNSEATQTKDKMYLERGLGCIEFQTLNNLYSMTEIPVETGRILQDRTQEFTLHRADEASETDHSKFVQEKILDNNYDVNDVQCGEDVLGSETSKQESRMSLSTEENSINEEMPKNAPKEAELNPFTTAKNNSIECPKDSSMDSSYSVSDYKECKSNQIYQLYKREDDEPQCKQTYSYGQGTCSTLGKMDLNSTCGTIINKTISQAALNDNRKAYFESPKKSFNMMPISGKAIPSPKEVFGWENLNEIQSHQPKQDSPKQVDGDENVTVGPLQVNSQNIHVSQAKDIEPTVQKPPIRKTTTGTARLSSKESQINDNQTSEAKDNFIAQNDLSLVSNVKAKQHHTLLNDMREKTQSLNNTVSERKYIEGQLEESCSFHIKPSGDLVNRSGRSAFDLSTSDKETEKMPVYLNFLDPRPWSKVNQVESQTMNTLASKVPLLLEERLVGSSENKKIPSKTLCQNLGLDAVMREIRMDTTSINRVADTLTNSSIQPRPKRDPREEWNAIAKTFYDSSFPTEHDKPKLLNAGLLSRPFQGAQEKDLADFIDCSLVEEEEDKQSQKTLMKNQMSENVNLDQPKKRKSEEILEIVEDS
ncbi:coiled-coil domain-containing protein 73 isoform X1 [Monodelphis domestica]|uniref:coiled-coil domain-containing protein 73 isoform X1 n=2 Tax=Monodelphis domestica TaxID=13616 RepID=UPI0024E21BFC|nr:coiled-coil domain-containing protein 73 isoform X1 [Monodelphis domestica]